MSASTHTLSPALSPFISGLHYHESELTPRLERILPSGRVHLLVNLDEDAFRTYDGEDWSTVRRWGGAVLEGAASRARVIDTRAQRCLVSVNFKLGGAAAFFGMPLSEARDALVDLHHLWGSDGASLRDRLLDAPTPADKLRAMERLLLDRLVRTDEPDPAIRRAVSLMERGVPVRHVAARVGLLPRTLARRFLALVGLTPKRFSRVRRLQRVVRSIGDPRDIDWSALAVRHGYADQAHLVHDFRELTALTPTAYLPRSPEEHNHVPVGTD